MSIATNTHFKIFGDDTVSIKQRVIRRIPLRYQVPLRYWYRRARRRLERELPIVCELLPRNPLAIDVGANNGVYTYALSRLGARVEAFEPLPGCVQALKAFTSRQVRVHAVALSSYSGESEIYVPREAGVAHTGLASFRRPTGSYDTVCVPVRKLDEYAFRDVSFIKIDVEGHELDVLKGAAETIAAFHPLLLVEVEQRHLSVPMGRVFDRFAALDYSGFVLLDGQVKPLRAFSYERHQEPFLQDVEGGKYVNNFIFLHERSPLRRRPDW